MSDGSAIYALRLTADLQRSRERLVTAREEERRRLRRDLHDGLRPQLATQMLKLEAARDLVVSDPAHAAELLSGLISDSQNAIAN
jgi:signal transduction histidine kinase